MTENLPFIKIETLMVMAYLLSLFLSLLFLCSFSKCLIFLSFSSIFQISNEEQEIDRAYMYRCVIMERGMSRLVRLGPTDVRNTIAFPRQSCQALLEMHQQIITFKCRLDEEETRAWKQIRYTYRGCSSGDKEHFLLIGV